MKLLIMIIVLLSTKVALAAGASPPQPKQWHEVATEESVQESGRLSKPLVDAPIVRSSKGCIAYLGENKKGEVIVRHLLDKYGKSVCRKEFAYGQNTSNDFK